MPPQRCCVCRIVIKGRTYSTSELQGEFLACFGISVLDRLHVNESGCICGTDYQCIRTYVKNGITRNDRIDCKGVRGEHGKRQIGGKRKLLPQPPASEEHEEDNPTCTPSTSSVGVGTEMDGIQVESASRKLSKLTNVSDNEPLNRDQEILYHKMTSNVVKNSAGTSSKHLKTFKTRPSHGPGLNVLVAPRTRVSSAECSRQTRTNRTEAVDEFERLLASDFSASEEEREEALTVQRATMIKRHHEEYSAAMKAAGFKTHEKFSRETVLDLRSKMPMSAWQYVKRSLFEELGINLMGTERELKKEISALEFEYECVSFSDSETGSKIHAIRATNLRDIISRTVNGLKTSGQLETLSNCPHDTLWIHISGDKGGKSTKIMLQVMNSTNRHSIKSAKLIGMFEGGKDHRDNIEMAFKPIFDQLKELKADFNLELTCPKPGATFTITSPDNNPMQNTLQPLDATNQTVSQECNYCKQNATCVPEQASDLSSDENFKNLRVTYGGDWEWLARIIGLSGPSGRHFCIHCLSVKKLLTDSKGSSYGLHELDNGEKDEIQENNTDEVSPYILRTFSGCTSSHNRYVQSGAAPDQVMKYKNCKYSPLIHDIDNDPIIDNVSTTPLHVSLGLGLQNVNVIEDIAIKLDNEVKECEGQTSAEVNELIADRRQHLDSLQNLADQKDVSENQIRDLEEQEQTLQQDNPGHFNKINRAFSDKTREAIASRAALRDLTREKNALKSELNNINKAVSDTEKQLEKTLTKIEKASGPFKLKFDNTMNALKLKRVVYHSGALIGPDVHKTLQPQSIHMFADIFQPQEITTKAGKQVFGSEDLVKKVYDLLFKFSCCYQLYTKNAPLCKHEVEQLCLYIMEFGSWFPSNFPDASLTPKFHMLTVEMPRQVRRLQTIGMMTEQVSESIHPYINKLERMFASTRDIEARQRLTMRQHNLLSGI